MCQHCDKRCFNCEKRAKIPYFYRNFGVQNHQFPKQILASYKLFFTNYRNTPVENGEIIVYKLADRDIPIVHRVIKRHENSVTGEVKYLTKGDNNQVDDRGLYTPGQKWIYKHEIIGRARGQCPYIGMVTIVLNDYPMVKYCTLAVIAGFMLIQRE